jgi:hypothetical protein
MPADEADRAEVARAKADPVDTGTGVRPAE